MFDLPSSTVVDRFLAKDKFYKKTTVAGKLKQQFTDEIEKITWTHKISPDTLNVSEILSFGTSIISESSSFEG